MSNLVKSKDPETWKNSSDFVLEAGYVYFIDSKQYAKRNITFPSWKAGIARTSRSARIDMMKRIKELPPIAVNNI